MGVNARHAPGREVAIDTRRGTWLSLDVSPDGSEIAFDLLGDLYNPAIGGGEARAISTGMPGTCSRAIRPTAVKLPLPRIAAAATSLDGAPRRIGAPPDYQGRLPAVEPADWSPDGNFIVARKHFTSARSLGSGEMWLYHRSGGDKGAGVQMTKARTKQKDTNEPAFSPDGATSISPTTRRPATHSNIRRTSTANLCHPAIGSTDRRDRTYVPGLAERSARLPRPTQELGLHPPRPLQVDADGDGHIVEPDHRADRHPRPRHAGNLGGAGRLSGN